MFSIDYEWLIFDNYLNVYINTYNTYDFAGGKLQPGSDCIKRGLNDDQIEYL